MAWIKSLGIVVGFLAVSGAGAWVVLISPPWLSFVLLFLIVIGYVRYSIYEDE